MSSLAILVIIALVSVDATAGERPRHFCSTLFSFLNGETGPLNGLAPSDREVAVRILEGLIGLAKPSETPAAVLQRLFQWDYGIPEESRTEQRLKYLADPDTEISVAPGPIPELASPLNQTIQARQVSKDLVVVQVEYARDTLLQNYVETSFFNLSQMLVPLVYRRSRLVKDELASTMKLMDRILDSQDIHTYFFGFHPVVWKSYVMRYNRILSEFPIPKTSDLRAWDPISKKIHSVWKPLYPSFLVIAAFPTKEGQFRRLSSCIDCTFTFVGLVRNDQPDPLGVVEANLTPSRESGIDFYQAVVSALPRGGHIELQSHTVLHDRFYRMLGFNFLRNETESTEWPEHSQIKTFAATRETVLSTISRSLVP